MKSIIFFIFLCLVNSSCVKQEILDPKIIIKFGHISENGHVVHVENYENQISILYNDLDTALTVTVIEYDLDCMGIDRNILNDLDNLEFTIYVNTSQDFEIYNAKNVYSFGRGGGRNISGEISALEYCFVLPVRKSDSEFENGKIEISDKNDFIRVSYESEYSAQSKVRTFMINNQIAISL